MRADDAYPDAGRHEDVLTAAVEDKGLGDNGIDPLGHRLGFTGRIAQVGTEDDELVPAQAAQRVTDADHLL
jgi:hypothetical protein